MEASETDQARHQTRVLPISKAEQGWLVEIIGFRSNRRTAQRLAEMGLTPGTTVRILRRTRSQPLLICVRGTYLAIDHQIADALDVRLLGTAGFGRRRRGWRRDWHWGWRSGFRRRRQGGGCDER